MRRRLERSSREQRPTPRSVDLTPFARLDRDGQVPVPLWSGYRDSIKASWRRFWWPTQVGYALRQHGVLTNEIAAVFDEIDAARTLPVPLGEIAAGLQPLAEEHPTLVRRLEQHDPDLGLPRLVSVPRPADVAALATNYSLGASRMAETFRAEGVDLERSSLLELGCGTGYMTFAVAAAGARRAVGIDLDLDDAANPLERDAVRAALLRDARAGAALLQLGDAQQAPFDDASFDAVFSVSFFEHVRDPAATLGEMRRLLRPGGLAYHVVDPWFGPQGGHSLATLDFPWGHARLRPEEFAAYVEEHRPHEALWARRFYDSSLQEPRLTLTEVERAVTEAGFELLRWEESRSRFGGHAGWIDADLLHECSHTAIPGLRDLLTDGYKMLLRRR